MPISKLVVIVIVRVNRKVLLGYSSLNLRQKRWPRLPGIIIYTQPGQEGITFQVSSTATTPQTSGASSLGLARCTCAIPDDDNYRRTALLPDPAVKPRLESTMLHLLLLQLLLPRKNPFLHCAIHLFRMTVESLASFLRHCAHDINGWP